MKSEWKYVGECHGKPILLSGTVSAPLNSQNCIDNRGPIGDRFICVCGDGGFRPIRKSIDSAASHLDWRLATDEDREAFAFAIEAAKRPD